MMKAASKAGKQGKVKNSIHDKLTGDGSCDNSLRRAFRKMRQDRAGRGEISPCDPAVHWTQ